MAEINRISVLKECLSIMRQEVAICSEHYNGLTPKKGMEEAWEQGRQKVTILQEMIQALQNESVRMALADWQKDLMKNGIQTELKFDEERQHSEADAADHPEERRVPGWYDPIRY